MLINKQLRKAVMTRSRLLNKLRKFNCPKNQFNWHRTDSVTTALSFSRDLIKKDFFNNLNVKKVTDNKHFWNTIKLNFTGKFLKNEKIVLVEDDKVITAETDLAKLCQAYFENFVESLHIERYCKVDFHKEPVVNAIKNFSQQPSMLKIKKNTNPSACFSFHTVSKEDPLYQLNSLDPKKATQKCDVPSNIIKKNYEIFQSLFLKTFMTLF